MKETGYKKTIQKKVCHCKNCGRTQSISNCECESCGADLGLYGQVKYMEVEADDWELLQEERKRQEAQELQQKRRQEKREQEEQARQEKLRREQKEQARQEKLRREQEEQARQEKLRREQEEQARQEKLRREQEEQARQEKLRRKQEERKHRKNERKKRGDDNSHRRFRVGKVVAAVFLCVIALVCLLAWNFNGENRCGPKLTWSFDQETGVLTIEGTGEMNSFAPANHLDLQDFSDTELEAAPWMEHWYYITSVVIGDKVTSIGSCAFAGCTKLKEVTLGNSLETIGQNAFYGANQLKNVIIPATVTRVDKGAFSHISRLRNLFFYGDPELVADVADWSETLVIIAGSNAAAHSYADQRDLVFVDLSQVREDLSVGGPASEGQEWSLSLTERSLTISGTGPMEDFNGTWMQDNAENMKNWDDARRLPYWTEYKRIIEWVKLEEGITSIGENAFENCQKLTHVKMCNTLQRIGSQSFLSTGITGLVIPEGVTQIQSHAFNFCEKLATVTLPSSLEVLENGTFNMCNNMIRLTFLGSQTQVQEREGAESVFSDGNNPEGRPHNLFVKGYVASAVQEYASAEGFRFEAIGIIDGFEDSGKCGNNITWRYVGDERTLYLDGYGSTWSYFLSYERGDYPQSEIHSEDPGWEPYKAYIEHIVLGGNIHTLRSHVFGDWDFDNNMVNLKSIDLGNVQVIQANLKQTKLATLEIPASVKHIDNGAFADNNYLKTVKVYGKTEFDATVFYGCPILKEVYFYDNPVFLEDPEGDSLFTGEFDPDYSPNPGLHFYVMRGSTAEDYAIQFHIPYSYLN